MRLSLLLLCLLATFALVTSRTSRNVKRMKSRLQRTRSATAALLESTAKEGVQAKEAVASKETASHTITNTMGLFEASEDDDFFKPSASLLEYPRGLTKSDLEYMQSTQTGPGSDPFDSPAGPNRKIYSDNINMTSTDMTITKPVRKNILHMSIAKQEAFILGINLLKDEAHLPPYGHNYSADDNSTFWNTWDWLSYKHFTISLAHPMIANGALFLPWHRQWLMLYEQNIARVLGDDSFTMPYWDWSNRYEATKIFTDKLMGGNGTGQQQGVSNGPFGDWKQKVDVSANLVLGPINRNLGVSHTSKKKSSWGENITRWSSGTEGANDLTPEQKEAGTFPSVCDVMKTMGTTKYYSGNDQCKPTFTFGAWYMHRQVHVAIGGDMNLVAANDPILLIHHTFLDKLWMMWQKAHRSDTVDNRYGFPEGAMTDNLRWVGGTAGDMLKWEEMPYHYQWDDTIDNIFYKYYYKGEGYQDMCWSWSRQTTGADGGRNFSLCHLTS